jgi:hypothetical protein
MTATPLNLTTVQKFRRDLTKLLADFGNEHGFDIKIGNIKFTATELRMPNVVAVVKGEPSRNALHLERELNRHGLQIENDRGDRLVEYNPRRYAYPFIYIKKSDGRRYKASLSGVISLGFGRLPTPQFS